MEKYLAFFDSGLGGLSTLTATMALMPREKYIYFGDRENAPYGNLSDEEIYRLARAGLGRLSRYPLKGAVIACNTVTTLCVDRLRREFDFPLFGVEPAVKPALAAGGKTLLLGTAATVRSEKLRRLVAGGDIDLFAPVGLAAAVEKGGEIDVKKHLPAGEKYANVVLGCTHYALIRDRIAACYPHARLFDGNEGTARHVRARLGRTEPPEGERGADIGKSAKNIGTNNHRQTVELMFEKDDENWIKSYFSRVFGEKWSIK